MDQANHLTSGPDLSIFHVSANANIIYVKAGVNKVTYTVLWITIDKDLATPCTTDIRRNLSKLARSTLLLDLERLIRDLVPVQPRGIRPAPEYESRVGLLGSDNLLLDVLVDRCLDGAHEARAHVDTAGSKTQRRSEPLPVGEAT